MRHFIQGETVLFNLQQGFFIPLVFSLQGFNESINLCNNLYLTIKKECYNISDCQRSYTRTLRILNYYAMHVLQEYLSTKLCTYFKNT